MLLLTRNLNARKQQYDSRWDAAGSLRSGVKKLELSYAM